MTYLPLVRLERDSFLPRLELARVFVLVIFSDVDQGHALELTYVYKLHLAELCRVTPRETTNTSQLPAKKQLNLAWCSRQNTINSSGGATFRVSRQGGCQLMYHGLITCLMLYALPLSFP